ncbi:hypothetical protein GCM10022419_034170 [Nonomuraea rosea]|uniref:Uncharacterized protein n=1 Tax=Nonomuraea rosea TaxID=638574 RepID=A0ABP6WIT3_9ACTN
MIALLAIVVALAVAGALLVASYRRRHPFTVIRHDYDTGMTGIWWRDEPGRTYWVRPATLDALRKGALR